MCDRVHAKYCPHYTATTLRIEVVVGYIFDLLSEAIFYLLQTFLTFAMVTLCYHGNHTKGKICAKFDAHKHHPWQEIHNNSIKWGYYLLPWQPLR